MKTGKLLGEKWFSRDAVTVARELLGKVIEYGGVSGMVVEAEAYKTDPASHAFRITLRSKIMLETHGYFYVYFTYGMHYCLNVTTNKNEVGAVLIRALEPVSGIEKMQRRRDTENIYNLTSGPAKLTQALSITKKLNGTKVGRDAKIYEYKKVGKNEIASSGRIGIRMAKDLPWRFFIKGNKHVSWPKSGGK